MGIVADFWPLSDSIHNLGLVGHIEDIVVNKDQQGKKLGLRIIEALDYIAEKVGCYKVSQSPCIRFCFYGCFLSTWSFNWAGVLFNATHLCPVRCLDTLAQPLATCAAVAKRPILPRLFHTLHSTLPHSLIQMLDKPNPFRILPS